MKRTNETIGAMRDGEVDYKAKLWTIPASRTKSGREHRIPLSARALEILQSIAEIEGDPWSAIREYLGDREMTAQTWAQILEGHFLKDIHKREGGNCEVAVPLWAYDLMIEVLQKPGPKRQRGQTPSKILGDDLKNCRAELLLEFSSRYPSQTDFSDAKIAFSWDDTVILIQALQNASHGRRGRPSLSLLDQLIYDRAVLEAKDWRSFLTGKGVSFDLAQEQAAAYLHEQYPMRSVSRILRDLEKADDGKPFRT